MGGSSDIGDLSDKTFDVGSNSYTIDLLYVGTGANTALLPAENLWFSLKSGLTTTEVAALRLHVCDDSFNFSAATYTAAEGVFTDSDHTYAWTGSGLDWSSVTSRTLYLSTTATNTAATGKPSISGTAQAGETLTAAKGTIADDDGLPATLNYQWVRVDGSNETDISGATSSTYTLVAADVGKKIKVKASFTDNGGTDEGPLTSDAYVKRQ